MGFGGVLAQARTSFDQRTGDEAYRQFAPTDAATPLDPDDLESWRSPRT
jgi:hypothetical protein